MEQIWIYDFSLIVYWSSIPYVMPLSNDIAQIATSDKMKRAKTNFEKYQCDEMPLYTIGTCLIWKNFSYLPIYISYFGREWVL